MKTLIADLDSGRPAARRKAKEALSLLGESALPALQKASAGKLSLEARRQVEEVLKGCNRPASSPQRIRQWRALEVLERVGSHEAQQLLRELAGGAPAAHWTREAQGCLQRLEKKPPRQREGSGR
jgi:hypothetical protein